jgi:hypothetical protein
MAASPHGREPQARRSRPKIRAARFAIFAILALAVTACAARQSHPAAGADPAPHHDADHAGGGSMM